MDRPREKHSASVEATPEEAPPSAYSAAGLRILREQAAQRVGQVVAAVKRWWSALSGAVAPPTPAPDRPTDVVQALKTFDRQLQVQESGLIACLAHANEEANRLGAVAVAAQKSEALGVRSDQEERAAALAAEQSDDENDEQVQARLQDLQRQALETNQMLERAEAELSVREQFNDLAKARVDRAAKRLSKLQAKIAAETDDHKRERLETRLKTIEVEQRIRKRVFAAVTATSVPWRVDREIDGERMPPHGMFSSPIKSIWGPATVVGAGGSLSEVEWADPQRAIEEATALLVAQTPRIKRGGPRKHVGHLVIAMPQGDGEIPFCLTPEAAMRMARQGLLSQGADPDLHDFVVFIHRKRREDGDDHDEEAVHVLWSKVRVDGKYLVNDNALVSAVVGRIRWDHAAGFDDGRIGVPGKEHYCVRRGLRILNRKLLTGPLADYNVTPYIPIEVPVEWDENKKEKLIRRLKKLRKDPDSLVATYRGTSGTADETVDFFAPEFVDRLAQEGRPDGLLCAGVWTPKRCYRSAESIGDILKHLYGG